MAGGNAGPSSSSVAAPPPNIGGGAAFDAADPKNRYDSLIAFYAAGQLPSGLVKAVIRAESGFDPRACSPAGARGLMQLMPATAARFGCEPDDLENPERNIEAGCRYLAWLYNRFWSNVADARQRACFAAASYNAGPGHIVRARNRWLREHRPGLTYGQTDAWQDWDAVAPHLRAVTGRHAEEPIGYVRKVLEGVGALTFALAKSAVR